MTSTSLEHPALNDLSEDSFGDLIQHFQRRREPTDGHLYQLNRAKVSLYRVTSVCDSAGTTALLAREAAALISVNNWLRLQLDCQRMQPDGNGESCILKGAFTDRIQSVFYGNVRILGVGQSRTARLYYSWRVFKHPSWLFVA